jgi:hypothetical protein
MKKERPNVEESELVALLYNQKPITGLIVFFFLST